MKIFSRPVVVLAVILSVAILCAFLYPVVRREVARAEVLEVLSKFNSPKLEQPLQKEVLGIGDSATGTEIVVGSIQVNLYERGERSSATSTRYNMESGWVAVIATKGKIVNDLEKEYKDEQDKIRELRAYLGQKAEDNGELATFITAVIIDDVHTAKTRDEIVAVGIGGVLKVMSVLNNGPYVRYDFPLGKAITFGRPDGHIIGLHIFPKGRDELVEVYFSEDTQVDRRQVEEMLRTVTLVSPVT